MTDKKPYLVSLKGGGLFDKGGVTETVAREMANPNAKGRHYMVVAEVVVQEIHDKLSGQMIADLGIVKFWPVANVLTDAGDLDNHLRELAVVLRSELGNDTGDQELDLDGPSPKVKDILAAGGRWSPHPFLPVDVSEENPICDVCGALGAATAHQPAANDPGDNGDDPDGDEVEDEVDEDGDPDPDDESFAPHAFDADSEDYACTICDQPVTADVHSAPDPAA
jgi:hypothetical protein